MNFGERIFASGVKNSTKRKIQYCGDKRCRKHHGVDVGGKFGFAENLVENSKKTANEEEGKAINEPLCRELLVAVLRVDTHKQRDRDEYYSDCLN